MVSAVALVGLVVGVGGFVAGSARALVRSIIEEHQ